MVTVMNSVGGKFVKTTAGSIAKMALKMRYGWRANFGPVSFLALYIYCHRRHRISHDLVPDPKRSFSTKFLQIG